MAPVRLPSSIPAAWSNCALSRTTTNSELFPKASVCRALAFATNLSPETRNNVLLYDTPMPPPALPPVTTSAPPSRKAATVRVFGAVDQLHEPDRHLGFLRCQQGLFGEEPRRAGMGRVPLGNHRISGRDPRREVAPRNPIEGERKIIRTEDGDRTDRL